MTVLSGTMIIIGLVGIVLPVLPGLLLVWGGVAVWALARTDSPGWLALGIATVLTATGLVTKYLLPGRRMRSEGVSRPALVTGVVLGLVGLFVVPVLGFVLGFVLGVYLAERYRLGEHAPALRSTMAAIRGVGVSMAIELLTGLLVAGTWLTALLLT